MWPDLALSRQLDTFRWRSDINVGLIIYSRFADDGTKSSSVLPIDPPSRGNDTMDGGLLWGIVTINKPNQPHYTPSIVYLCSNNAEPEPPTKKCSDYGFLEQLEFGTSSSPQTKAWPMTSGKTATVVWTHWNQNNLDQFDWVSQLAVGAIVYSEVAPDGVIYTHMNNVALNAGTSGTVAMTVVDGQAYVPHVIYLCSNRPAFAPSRNCSDEGFDQEVTFDALSTNQVRTWVGVSYRAYLRWPTYSASILDVFRWRSDINVTRIIVSRYAPNGTKETDVRDVEPPTMGHDVLDPQDNHWWGVASVGPSGEEHYVPSMIYLCGRLPVFTPPERQCPDVGFLNTLTFGPMLQTETKPWPADAPLSATVTWPNWEAYDIFIWKSGVPVGSVIFSELSPAGVLQTHVNIIPPSQALGVGTVELSVESGVTYAPQVIYLCGGRAAYVPNITCRSLGFDLEVVFNTSVATQQRMWDWPSMDYAAFLRWTQFPVLHEFHWRSQMPVKAVIIAETPPDGGDGNVTIYRYPTPSLGDETLQVSRTPSGASYAPSYVYLCGDREVPAPPNTSCSDYGYQYQVAFGREKKHQSAEWPQSPSDRAAAVWPEWPVLDQFYWNSTTPVGALIYSELDPNGTVTTAAHMLTAADGLGVGTDYSGGKYGEITTTIDPMTGAAYTPQVIYMCSHRPVYVRARHRSSLVR